MFDIGTKFRYFHGVLKEVYKIIEINFEMRDSDLPKLIKIIKSHLDIYNSKTGMLQMSCIYEDDCLEVFMSDNIIGRGRKKLFSDKIVIKSIIRDKIIDLLLDDDPDQKLYE